MSKEVKMYHTVLRRAFNAHVGFMHNTRAASQRERLVRAWIAA